MALEARQFLGLVLESPPELYPRPQAAIMIPSQSLFPYKTQSSPTKRTLVKVNG